MMLLSTTINNHINPMKVVRYRFQVELWNQHKKLQLMTQQITLIRNVATSYDLLQRLRTYQKLFRKCCSYYNTLDHQKCYYVSSSMTHSAAQSAAATTTVSVPLNYEWIVPTKKSIASIASAAQDTSDNTNVIVFVHGLLGNIRNIKTMATKLCQQTNRFGILIDLPGHGLSYEKEKQQPEQQLSMTSSGHNEKQRTLFDETVDKIHGTIKYAWKNHPTMILPSSSSSSITMVGHSLGGRLLLQYVYNKYCNDDEWNMNIKNNNHNETFVKQLWLLDTAPGTVDSSVHHVLQTATKVQQMMLQKENQQLSSSNATTTSMKKNELVQLFTNEPYRIDQSTAQWLASSFNVHTNEFNFNLSLAQLFIDAIHQQDLVQMIRTIIISQQQQSSSNNDDDNNKNTSMMIKRPSIHLIQGGKNKAWKHPTIQSDIDNLLRLVVNDHNNSTTTTTTTKRNCFKVHTLPNAGHWVHIDDLPGLINAFVQEQ